MRMPLHLTCSPLVGSRRFDSSIPSILHPTDPQDTVFEAVQKDETNLEYERFQLDTPNGEVPVDGSARPITWDDSQAVVYVLQDISDRIGYEEQLERTHELLEHTERIADVGSWEVDTDSMDVFWSGASSKSWGSMTTKNHLLMRHSQSTIRTTA